MSDEPPYVISTTPTPPVLEFWISDPKHYEAAKDMMKQYWNIPDTARWSEPMRGHGYNADLCWSCKVIYDEPEHKHVFIQYEGK